MPDTALPPEGAEWKHRPEKQRLRFRREMQSQRAVERHARRMAIRFVAAMVVLPWLLLGSLGPGAAPESWGLGSLRLSFVLASPVWAVFGWFWREWWSWKRNDAVYPILPGDRKLAFPTGLAGLMLVASPLLPSLRLLGPPRYNWECREGP